MGANCELIAILKQVRGTLGGTALILLFYSIQNLSLADALVISSCRPVFVTVVAHVFLGEPCGIFPAFAALLSVVGVGFITRPPVLTGDDHFNEDTVVPFTELCFISNMFQLA